MKPARTIQIGLRQRLLAFLYDYIFIAIYIAILVGLGAAANLYAPSAISMLFGSAAKGQLSTFLMLTLPVTLYFAIQESSPAQATWGKRRVRLRVVTTQGERLTFRRALLRSLLKLGPWELAHTCIWQLTFAADPSSPIYLIGFALVWLLVAAYLASIALDKSRRSLYDRIAGTQVVQDVA